MERAFRPLTASDQEFATSMARQHKHQVLRNVEALQNDDKRAARLEKGECPTCFYLKGGRIGGAAMTMWHCGVCRTPHQHGSTAVPKVCQECATAHNLCTQCGGDRDLSENRTQWATPTGTTSSS